MIAAGLVERIGHNTWWLCPSCRQKLGEIVGCRVVVRVRGVHLSFALRNEPEQTCPRCGAVSMLRQEVAA